MSLGQPWKPGLKRSCLTILKVCWVYLPYGFAWHVWPRPLNDCTFVDKCPHWVQYNTPLSHCARWVLCSFLRPHHIGPLSERNFKGLFFSGFPYSLAPGQLPSENAILELVDSQNCPQRRHSSILSRLMTSCFNTLSLATLYVRWGNLK